ncbi:hypothetical protein [Candidatus Sororendozoicomonas aggregata]|uniref:hypothetical protein n=1 Tax=Candidatus Sororendozoicomonas aggregata TaxID=3073239 RepID=UPI002ED67D78
MYKPMMGAASPDTGYTIAVLTSKAQHKVMSREDTDLPHSRVRPVLLFTHFRLTTTDMPRVLYMHQSTILPVTPCQPQAPLTHLAALLLRRGCVIVATTPRIAGFPDSMVRI